MEHLRVGKLFPMTWEPSMDKSRRQLEYVNAPKADSGKVLPDHRSSGRSHMADGFQEEFTSIQRMYIASHKHKTCLDAANI